MGEIIIDNTIKDMLVRQCMLRYNSLFENDVPEEDFKEVVDQMFILVEYISVEFRDKPEYIDNVREFISDFEKSIYNVITYNNRTYPSDTEHKNARLEATEGTNTLLRSLEKYIKFIYYLLKRCKPDSNYRHTLRDEFKQAYLKNKANTNRIIRVNLDTLIQLTIEDRNDFSHYNIAGMKYKGLKVLEAYDLLITWLVFTRIYMELNKNEELI